VLDVLLFGATGYTGRLTAAALARRGARYAVAGRDATSLEAVARAHGAADARVASVGDPEGLARAVRDARVLVSCVGPFSELGDTAVAAALAAGVHYVDCSGEASFVARLIDRYDAAAQVAGLALAPAMAFDEAPADVAATLAAAEMADAEVALTYALPGRATRATIRSAARSLAGPGSWLENGRRVGIRTGARTRWAPMPPPLGPRRSISAPMPESHLATLHLDLKSATTWLTVGPLRRRSLLLGLPALRAAGRVAPARRVLESALALGVRHPDEDGGRPARWTVLAEARGGGPAPGARRSVVLTGTEPYRLSAQLLAFGSLALAAEGHGRRGVLSPVQAAGLEPLRKELTARGVTITIY
jgi:short subunit dehydrogenase-like uncharacterized protein